MSLAYKEVAEILKIIDSSACEEVVLELEGFRLTVRRGAGGHTPAATTSPQPVASAQAAPATAAQATGAPQAGQDAAPAGAAGDPDAIEVRSPMVGTFYSRPSPDEARFVERGSRVKKGDPLCLIEVMKLYTTIEATADGVVRQIVPTDGEMVEFDQLLFRLDPA